MGSVIQCMAIYDEPFWRAEGLSGQAISLRPGAGGLRQHASRRRRADGVHRGSRRARSAPFPRPSGARSWSRTSPASSARRANRRGTSRRTGPASPTRAAATRVADPRDLDRLRPRPARAGRPHRWAGTETATRWMGYFDGAIRRASGSGRGARRRGRGRRPGGRVYRLTAVISRASSTSAASWRSSSAPAACSTSSASPTASCACPTGNSVEHLGADVVQHLAQLGLGPDGSEQPGAGADHQNRLPLEALSGKGREAQSIAFLRPPGIEALYSGVLITTASADAIASQALHGRRRAVGVEVLVVDRQLADPDQLSSPPAAAAAARSRRVLWSRSAAIRRCPQPSSLLALPGLDQLQVDVQGHVPIEDVAAARQLHLPVEAEVAAVELGLELERDAPVPVGTVDRLCRCPWRSPSCLPAISSSPAMRARPSSLSSIELERSSWMLGRVEELHAKHGRGTPRARGSRSTRPWRPPAPAVPVGVQRGADVVEGLDRWRCRCVRPRNRTPSGSDPPRRSLRSPWLL